MKTTIHRFALAGILSLGVALAATLPASAHERGRLKADKAALHQAHHDLNHANTRAERKADRIQALNDRATLDQERILIKGQDHKLHAAKKHSHLL